jgi:hypothetical protein
MASNHNDLFLSNEARAYAGLHDAIMKMYSERKYKGALDLASHLITVCLHILWLGKGAR